MDWNIRKNLRYLLAMAVCCALIPHGVLSLLRLESVSASLAPVQAESYANFFVCQWIPFCLAFITYLRLQKQDSFSLLPAVFGLAAIASFLGRFNRESVMAIAWTVPLILVPELSGFLKKAESCGSRVLSRLAADRGALRAVFFWTVELLCVAIISCKASTWYSVVVFPFLTFPILAILLWDVFRRQEAKPLTLWGSAGILLMAPTSLWLATVGPMAKFRMYHLGGLGIGFAILFAMLLVFNLDRFKRPAH